MLNFAEQNTLQGPSRISPHTIEPQFTGSARPLTKRGRLRELRMPQEVTRKDFQGLLWGLSTALMPTLSRPLKSKSTIKKAITEDLKYNSHARGVKHLLTEQQKAIRVE